MLDDEGRIRDLGDLIPDIDPERLRPAALHALRAIDPRHLPLVDSGTRLGTPWRGMGQFIAVGLNYRAHAAETKSPIPDQPVLFAKWLSCLSGPDDDIIYPHDACMLDWEVELGIVIGSTARRVSEPDALKHVAGYCLSNDVSDRYFQKNGGAGQWGKGKGFESFGPVGPYLVTAEEIPDVQNLDLWLSVNGVQMQRSNTSDMIFSCAKIVSHCSLFMTLEPGDLIITGTPQGVGWGMNPPVFLKPGDLVRLGIDGLGTQTQRVVAASRI
jgi:2-keto-4-pentenoate hydratase/2-oxohepta-3-ene-1,7-dioic acid hydratase in catechol pathway